MLGVNGVGKIIIFKILIGDEIMIFGEVYFNGYSVKLELVMVCIKYFERIVVIVFIN